MLDPNTILAMAAAVATAAAAITITRALQNDKDVHPINTQLRYHT